MLGTELDPVIKLYRQLLNYCLPVTIMDKVTTKTFLRCGSWVITLTCLTLAFMQLKEIFNDYVSGLTTTVTEQVSHEKLVLPYITICAQPGYKGVMDHYASEEEFLANTYDMEDLLLVQDKVRK